jgi:hypothetical protein
VSEPGAVSPLDVDTSRHMGRRSSCRGIGSSGRRIVTERCLGLPGRSARVVLTYGTPMVGSAWSPIETVAATRAAARLRVALAVMPTIEADKGNGSRGITAIPNEPSPLSNTARAGQRRLRDRSGQLFQSAKQIFGNNGRPAAVHPIAILFGRCVGEMLPWSSPENIGRLF